MTSPLAAQAQTVKQQAETLLRDIQSRHTRKLYLAGPMSDRPAFNRPAFFAMAEQLEQAGYVVLNPAIFPDGLAEAEYMQLALQMVHIADGLVMLEGWQHSPGAVTEYHLAYKLCKTIVMEEHVFEELIRQAAC